MKRKKPQGGEIPTVGRITPTPQALANGVLHIMFSAGFSDGSITDFDGETGDTVFVFNPCKSVSISGYLFIDSQVIRSIVATDGGISPRRGYLAP